MSKKIYQNIKTEKVPGSKIRISGEINAETFEKSRTETLKKLSENVEIPGFRIGKAPETIVVKHLGEMRILEKTAENLINDTYPEILKDENIRAIGMPSIAINKIARNNPLGFVIETAVMPEIVLENYKQAAKKSIEAIPEAPDKVEEKEIDDTVEGLRKRMAGENKELPELNLEFVKRFGDFENVEDFRKKVEENLVENKKRETKDKRRASVADALVNLANFEVPDVIVESELDTMINQFKADVERSGMTFDGYLKHIKRGENDIRNEWRDKALRRAKLELVLKHIARTEKITPDEKEVKEKVDHLLSHYKDADRFQARMYIENLMTNEMVLEFLEK